MPTNRRHKKLSPELRRDLMFNIFTRLALKSNDFDALLRQQTQEALGVLEEEIKKESPQDVEVAKQVVDDVSRESEAKAAIKLLQEQYRYRTTENPRDSWTSTNIRALLNAKKMPREFLSLILGLEYSTICRWLDGSRMIHSDYWPALNKLTGCKKFEKETIIKIRESFGFDRRDLAEIMNLSLDAVEAWENGTRVPSPYNWVILFMIDSVKKLLDQKEKILTARIREELARQGEDGNSMNIFI